MNRVFEALLDLNKEMVMENMDATYDVVLTMNDFDRLFLMFSKMNGRYMRYETAPTLKTCTWFKVAGTGGYITFKRGEMCNGK